MKRLVILACTVLLCLTVTAQSTVDIVKCKNGSEYVGIIEDNTDDYIRIVLNNGLTRIIYKEDLLTVSKGDGEIYVTERMEGNRRNKTIIRTKPAAITAQPRSVGVRLGSGINLSYQHYVPNMDFMKADNAFITADLDIAWTFNYFCTTTTYNFINPFNAIIPWYGNWNWYLGAGAGINFGWHTDKSGDYAQGFEYNTTTAGFGFGIAAQVGIEYEFEFPLTVALEYRPVIGPEFYTSKVSTTGPDGTVSKASNRGVAFGTQATYLSFGLACRYRF